MAYEWDDGAEPRISDLPYAYTMEEGLHLIIDRRDRHVVARYEHFGIAVTVGAALNDEFARHKGKTLDSDFVRLELKLQDANFTCKKLGLEWPPPERLYINEFGLIRPAADDDDEEFVLERVSMSELSDEIADHPNLARGALYRYVGDPR